MTNKNSLLWEIQLDKNFKGYIFGTMHVSADIAFSDLSLIHSLIEKCDVFATEIPLDMESQQQMSKHITLPDHVQLSNLFSDRKFLKYRNILSKSFGLDIQQFNKVLPIFLLNYMTKIAIQVDPSNIHESMDFQFWNFAKEQGKEMASVESIDDHINTLYGIPLDYQIKSLNSALRNVSKFREKSLKMLEIYKSQDIHKLYTSSKKSIGAIREIILYARNENISSNIEKLIENDTLFSAFGAGHLSGKKGVISKLKSKGFTLKPIHFS